MANTGEVLWLINRPGSPPSHKGAAVIDRAVAFCREGGSREVLLRGDSSCVGVAAQQPGLGDILLR